MEQLFDHSAPLSAEQKMRLHDDVLDRAAWDLNVRELRDRLYFAELSRDRSKIQDALEAMRLRAEWEHLQRSVVKEKLLRAEWDFVQSRREAQSDSRLTLDQDLRKIEIERIKKALLAARGNTCEASRILGVKRTTLASRVARLGLRELVRQHSR